MTTTMTKPLTGLDKAMADLGALGVAVKPFDAWKKTVGWAKDDPIYEEAMRLGAAWREDVNRKSLEDRTGKDGHS